MGAKEAHEAERGHRVGAVAATGVAVTMARVERWCSVTVVDMVVDTLPVTIAMSTAAANVSHGEEENAIHRRKLTMTPD